MKVMMKSIYNHNNPDAYRLIMNSQIPLNVNFFCGDCRIAIVTAQRRVKIDLINISRLSSQSEVKEMIITQSNVRIRWFNSGCRIC